MISGRPHDQTTGNSRRVRQWCSCVVVVRAHIAGRFPAHLACRSESGRCDEDDDAAAAHQRNVGPAQDRVPADRCGVGR
jgi:hypothetical protein